MNVLKLHCLQALFVLGILLTVQTGYTQQIIPAPEHDPAITWLAAGSAKIQLENKLNVLQPQLADLTPGTPAHTDLLRQIIFYKAILRAVALEIPVPQAIHGALPDAATLGGVHELAFTPEATLRLLYEEAVDLLKA